MTNLCEASAFYAIRKELEWLEEEEDILDKMEHQGDSEETEAYFRGKRNTVAQEYSRLLYWIDEFEFGLEREKEAAYVQEK